MRKRLLLTLGLSLAALLFNAAADGKNVASQPRSAQLKEDARYILQRTEGFLNRAETLVKKQNARWNRDSDHHLRSARPESLWALETANAYQEKAKDYYLLGMYQPSIDASLEARAIAIRFLMSLEPDGRNRSGKIQVQNGVDDRESAYWARHQAENPWDRTNDGYDILGSHETEPFAKYDF